MNEESQALFDKARESLAAAEHLLNAGFYDFSASRSYYGMFYLAELLLLEIGQTYSKHGAVIAAFGREYIKTNLLPVELHRWLIDAQDYRNIGDYGIGIHIKEAQAREIYEWGKRFFGQVTHYLLQT